MNNPIIQGSIILFIAILIASSLPSSTIEKVAEVKEVNSLKIDLIMSEISILKIRLDLLNQKNNNLKKEVIMLLNSQNLIGKEYQKIITIQSKALDRMHILPESEKISNRIKKELSTD